MKTILMSINPKWCELIASGKKTIEVRKTAPLETPFRVVMYCTKNLSNRRHFRWGNEIFYATNNKEVWSGKVIGEFVCDKIDIYSKSETISKLQKEILFKKACLTGEQLYEYVFDKTFYAWNISDLKIYDKPKELSEFYVKDLQAVKQCEYRERVFTNPETTNGVCLKGSYLCNKTSDWCDNCKHKPLLKAPQSWCYIESLEE